jgi:hypothetical protein
MCELACPNRWLLRIAFDFLAALLVIYALLALWNCRLREFFQRWFWYFFAYGSVTALIFGVSLVCDPFWKEISDYVMLAIVLLLSAFIGMRWLSSRQNLP